MTHTYATLEVTRATFNEVKRRLHVVDYDHTFHYKETIHGLEVDLIDMHGIALVMEDDGEEQSNDRSGGGTK